jgi:hypothetical protein
MNDTMRGALIAGGAAVLGSLLSGAYQHFRDWFHRPALEIGVDKKDGPPNITQSAWDDKNQRIEKVFARVSVHNVGRTPAVNTRLFLISLDEVVSGNTLNRRGVYESFQIPWAGYSFEGKNLPKGVVSFADLVRIDKTTPGWEFSGNLPDDLRAELVGHHGTFKFGIVGTADNASPSYATICVDYWGDWHKIRIWKD